MATDQQNAAGGGLFSKLVIIILLAVTVGFYLKIVMLDQKPQTTQWPVAQVSVQVVENEVRGAAAGAAPLKDLPDDQMSLIKQVFAPELGSN